MVYTATIIRIIEHRENREWYKIVLNINSIYAETSFMPRSDVISRFNLTQGQLLDYINR